jgi:hypothetical protein
MENKPVGEKKKITLPKPLQREMQTFFLQYAQTKNAAADKERQQTPKNQK